jgi:hypothetical protein
MNSRSVTGRPIDCNSRMSVAKRETASRSCLQAARSSSIVRAAQPAAELLEEHGRAFRRPQKKHGVDLRDIDAFVEEVDGEEAVDLPLFEFAQRVVAFEAGAVRRHVERRDAGFVEAASHVARVLDPDAEAEGDRRP